MIKHHEGKRNQFLLWLRKLSITDSKNKYHTVLIMSSFSGKRIAQLYFPIFVWWVSSVAAGAILFLAGAGTWSFYQNHRLTERSNCLEREKQMALSQLVRQKKELEYLSDRLKGIQAQAAYIQNYLGLDSNGKAKGKIGQGGGEVSAQLFSEPSPSSLWGKQSLPAVRELSQPVKISRQSISRLDNDLDQLIKSLEKRQQELEHTPSISPIEHEKAWISCGYGMRISPFTGKKQFHPGVDLAGWKGTPVKATANGTVDFAKEWGSMGLTVKIRHNSNFLTTYGHLLRIAVKKDQPVKRGEIIGYVGNSGRSTGYHLHYEIEKDGKRLNPYDYMTDWINRRTMMASGESD